MIWHKRDGLSGIGWFKHGSRVAAARQRVRTSRNYLCYYGRGALSTLSTFDLAILAAEAYSRPELEQLAQAGCATLGYVSLGQDATVTADSPWLRRGAHS